MYRIIGIVRKSRETERESEREREREGGRWPREKVGSGLEKGG